MAYRLTDSGLPIFSVSPSSRPASRKNSRSCPSGTPNTKGSPQSMAFLIIPLGYFVSTSSPPRLMYSSSSVLPGADSAANRAQRLLYPFLGDVHAEAFGNEVRLAIAPEPGTPQHVGEAFSREIDRGVDQVSGRAAEGCFDAPLLVLLSGAVIDLDDRDVFQKIGEPVGTRIESGAQDDHLRRAAANGTLQPLIDVARPHQHQPDETEDVGIVHRFLKILVERLADGMFGDQNQL